jgi:hypothetical protein
MVIYDLVIGLRSAWFPSIFVSAGGPLFGSIWHYMSGLKAPTKEQLVASGFKSVLSDYITPTNIFIYS